MADGISIETRLHRRVRPWTGAAPVPTAAAIAQAIAHATGVRRLPLTPERVLAALGSGS